MTKQQKLLYLLLIIFYIFLLTIEYKNVLINTFLLIHLFYLALVIFKFIISARAEFLDETYGEITEYPIYTILLPMYKEVAVFNKLIKSIDNLNYPKDKLDVKILLEIDDLETINHIKTVILPSYFNVIIVPEGFPKTKPRACNYGLDLAKGMFLAIYDAEDIPEPDQLKKAVYEFNRLGEKYACLQAKLNWFNAKENWLTKMFCIEYTTWFNYFIHGLAAFDLPYPLGGTSNHFRTKVLKAIGGWDSYNVTEDADLGIRIQANGYKTGFINSTTLEESVTEFWPWMKQRTRWIKGYIQTFLVHTRNFHLLKHTGFKGLLSFWFFIFGTFFVNIMNPILYGITILWYIFGIGTFLYPDLTWYIGIFCLIFGNLSIISISFSACRKQNIAIYSIFLPIYWMMMSLATYRALWYIIVDPHKWEKTEHGKTTFNVPNN